MALNYSVNEFAKANTNWIQAEDEFIVDIRQEVQADPTWNSRMSEFMMPIWKLRSKIKDLRLELDTLLKYIWNKLNSTNNQLAKHVKVKNWDRETFEEIGRKFHRLDFVLKSYSTKKLKTLRTYELKATRMVSRAKQEEESYSVSNESSSKIMDPRLDETTIRGFIIYGLRTMKIAAKLGLSYNNLHGYLLKSQLQFYKRKQDMIQQLPAQSEYEDPNQVGKSGGDCGSGFTMPNGSF